MLLPALSDEWQIEAFRMTCRRRILFGIYIVQWYDFVTNTAPLEHTKEDSIDSIGPAAKDDACRCSATSVDFQHKPHSQLTLPCVWKLELIDAHSGRKLDNRYRWRCPRGRPRRAWIRQMEDESGLSADAAWNIANDLCKWRAQRPPPVMRAN